MILVGSLIPAAKYVIPAAKILNYISYQFSKYFDSQIVESSPHNYKFNLTPAATDKKTASLFLGRLPQGEVIKTAPKDFHAPLVQIEKPGEDRLPAWSSNFRFALEHRDLLNDPFNADLEHLVKVEINRPLLPGHKIPMKTVGGKTEFYTVHRKIVANGLVSYALTPAADESSLSPLIVFRATEHHPLYEQAIPSMKNDVDKHIGERGWSASEKMFEELMQDRAFRKNKTKVKVAGYSLGGAHAQYFIAKYHPSVSHGIFYNDPSIDPKITEQFASEIQETHRDQPLILQIFRTSGDPVHLFGGKHLGCDADHPNLSTQLLEIDIPGQMNFDAELHRKRLFDTNQFDYSVREFTDPKILSKKLDNQKRNPISALFESIRKAIGGFLSIVLSTLEPIFDLMKKALQRLFRSKSSHLK